jgi:Flp pilus assembly protein TadD
MMTTAAKKFRTGLSAALMASLLAGCAMGGSGSHPSKFASGASSALEKGDAAKAVSLAEQAVLSDPRNADYRVLLGNAYLRAGRFVSAQQAYNEAIDLGADSGKAGLSLALADVALGHNGQALDTLATYRDSIPASDLGLALALAGDTARGVAVLVDALRSGENTAKIRQNLAYAYALDGKWREARVMASQDVPAGQLDARMGEWALLAKPEDAQARVAALIGVPAAVADAGQPAALALANYPSTDQLAQEAQTAQGAEFAQAAVQELPAVAQSPEAAPLIESQPAVQFAAWDASASSAAPEAPAPAPRRSSAYRVVGDYIPETPAPAPVIPAPQPAPPASKAQAPAPRQTASVAATPDRSTHVVQLGSFATPEGARRAWRHYSAKMPQLKGYRNVTTQVTVNGRQFWRVQAAGFAGYGSARTMCGSVKARGGVCLVMAAPRTVSPQGRPVNTRMARRR